jgi:hypothetical protein
MIQKPGAGELEPLLPHLSQKLVGTSGRVGIIYPNTRASLDVILYTGRRGSALSASVTGPVFRIASSPPPLRQAAAMRQPIGTVIGVERSPQTTAAIRHRGSQVRSTANNFWAKMAPPKPVPFDRAWRSPSQRTTVCERY